MRRRRVWIAAGVLAAALASGVSALDGLDRIDDPADIGADVGAGAARIHVPDVALLVSDSAWLGIRNYGAVDAVQGFAHMLDLGSCRRRVTKSCTNYDGHVPITMLEEIEWRGSTTSTLIVATGYNDSDTTFRSDFETIVAATRRHGYDRVVWLTLRDDVTYRSPDGFGFGEVFVRNNATLHELVATGNYPEVVIADWSTYANEHPEWFAADGIHVRREGPWAAADYISRKMAFLDGRACPEPTVAGGEAANPCPDPDVTGPVADIAGLYPVGRVPPNLGFYLEWAGHSSWPSTPWWQQ